MSGSIIRRPSTNRHSHRPNDPALSTPRTAPAFPAPITVTSSTQPRAALPFRTRNVVAFAVVEKSKYHWLRSTPFQVRPLAPLRESENDTNKVGSRQDFAPLSRHDITHVLALLTNAEIYLRHRRVRGSRCTRRFGWLGRRCSMADEYLAALRHHEASHGFVFCFFRDFALFTGISTANNSRSFPLRSRSRAARHLQRRLYPRRVLCGRRLCFRRPYFRDRAPGHGHRGSRQAFSCFRPHIRSSRLSFVLPRFQGRIARASRPGFFTMRFGYCTASPFGLRL